MSAVADVLAPEPSFTVETFRGTMIALNAVRSHASRTAAGTAAVAVTFAMAPAPAIARPVGTPPPGQCREVTAGVGTDVSVKPAPLCGKSPRPRRPLPYEFLPHTGMTATGGYGAGVVLILTGALAVMLTTRRRSR